MDKNFKKNMINYIMFTMKKIKVYKVNITNY